MTTLLSLATPAWLRLICVALSPRYRKRWTDLEKRSHVTGVAREEVVLWSDGHYRLVVSREVRKRDA